MSDASGAASITYNGEIYNFLEIRAELERLGVRFRSRSDTEVVLQALQRWRIDAVKRFRGMFAFAAWDPNQRQLTLARDPLGIKPLYYFSSPHGFLFASEVRALLDSGLVPRRLSRSGVASFLRHGSVAAPETIIDGIRCLPPGHVLTLSGFGEQLRITETNYSQGVLRGTARIPDRRAATESLLGVLKDSVARHLISDVPVGVFLSGGLDSSALVALIREVGSQPPKTFTVTFRETAFNEASYAKLVADRFQTDHQEICLTEDMALSLLPEAFKAMDQPTMDGVNTFVVSKAVRGAGVKVALSGLGSDEIFAGYASFARAARLRRMTLIPRPLRAAAAAGGRVVLNGSVAWRKLWDLAASDGSPSASYTISRRLFGSDELQSLLDEVPPEPRVAADEDEDCINAISRCELQGYMANTLLRDTDSMSMAHALEVRVPFVDVPVIQHVLSMPGEWKLDPRRPKSLLIDALGGRIPDAVWRRKKMGFTLPFDTWMLSALRSEMDHALGNGSLARTGIRREAANQVWKAFQTSPQSQRWSRPWSLYVLQKWCADNSVSL